MKIRFRIKEILKKEELDLLPASTRVMAEQVSLLVGMVFLILMGIIAYFRKIMPLVYIDAAAAAFLGVCFAYYRKSGKNMLALAVAVYFMIPVFLLLLVYGGEEATAHVWIFTFPLFSMYALGSRNGTAASLLMIFSVALYFLFQKTIGMFSIYPLTFILRFIPAYFAVALFSFVSKRSHEISQGALEKVNEELKTAMAKAEAASLAKSKFLANISHELRTPLNHVIGFTELVATEKAGSINEMQKEYLNDALESGQHLLSLINDLLDLARIEAGKMTITRTSMDLDEIIRISLASFSQEAAKKNIELSFISSVPQADILGDRLKMKQILYNLIANSIKFTSEGGRISVSLSETPRAGSHWEFIVQIADTGIGIREEDLELIFHAFERADTKREKTYPGAGLGLALSRQLIQAHGGRLWANSEGPGLGSSFFIAIPGENSSEES